MLLSGAPPVIVALLAVEKILLSFCRCHHSNDDCRRRTAAAPGNFVVRIGTCCDVDPRPNDLFFRFLCHHFFDLARRFFVDAKASACGVAGANWGVAGCVNASSHLAESGSVVIGCSFPFGGKDHYCWRGLFFIC